jgi:hypothetical protein
MFSTTDRDASTLRNVLARCDALDLILSERLGFNAETVYTITDPAGREVIMSRRPAHLLSALVAYQAALDRAKVEKGGGR